MCILLAGSSDDPLTHLISTLSLHSFHSLVGMPSHSSTETLDRMKEEIRKSLESSVKKIGDNLSTFRTNVETVKSKAVTTLSSSAVCKNVDSSVRMIGQNFAKFGRNVETLKGNFVAAISSSVVVENFSILCKNVQRNARTLTSQDASAINSLPTLDASTMICFSSAPSATWNNMPGGAGNPRAQFSQPTSFPSLPVDFVTADPLDGLSEERPHPDHSSVSSTTVFSIGSIGPPLLGLMESESLESSQLNNVPEEASVVSKLDVPDMAEWSSSSASDTLPRLEAVRRVVGNAAHMLRGIRCLGFRESSWENKMPWRNPPPAYLAKGLQFPRKKFSSSRERYEYHRRARRRGRYIYGPIPGWSWFAADVILLYFLINNPAGKFLL